LRCVITIKLLREAKIRSKHEIERDITEEMEEIIYLIPWAQKIEKVTVIPEN